MFPHLLLTTVQPHTFNFLKPFCMRNNKKTTAANRILKNDFIVRIHKCYKGASHTLKNSHTENIKAFVSLQVSFFPGVTRSPPLHDVRPHFKIQCRLEH